MVHSGGMHKISPDILKKSIAEETYIFTYTLLRF